MHRLAAVHWDRDGAPAPGGLVRLLFDRTCYLSDGDGALIPVTDRAAGVMPGGLSVDLPDGLRFPTVIRQGARAASRGGVLRFEGGLTVDLRTAEDWGATPDLADGSVADPTMLSAVRLRLRDVVCERAPEILPEVDRIAAGLPDMRGAAERLVGLGPGLTPAGDDYLVGLAAGCRSDALMRALPLCLDRTNDVSRVLLSGALRGVFPERLVDFAHVLLQKPSTEQADRATQAVSAFGHSSGAVMGLGFADGLVVGARLTALPA